MKSSILIVGHPEPSQVEFGADHTASYDEALTILTANKYAVVVAADRLSGHSQKELVSGSFEFFRQARTLNQDVQTILVGTEISPHELQKAINDIGLFKTIPSFDVNALSIAVREALEEYELIKQNQAFLTLTQEQNQRLQHLSSLLEERVRAREKFLVEAREKLLQTTKRTEALNRALVAIQKGVVKHEIEQHLNDALQMALGLSWTKILLYGQNFYDQIEEKKTKHMAVFSAPLLRGAELLGHIYFARDQRKPFDADEDDFLLQVSDAVALAIDRLMSLEATEALKQEWDSTFDSVTEPLALVDENYQIIRANKAYASRSTTPLPDVAGKKCFEILFSREAPCERCHLGEDFELGEISCRDGTQAHYSVSTHPVQIDNGKRTFALFYRDTSEEQRIHRQILESSKMAEIGTIGSSIAHEINNPLGGMLAFIQILKSELKSNDKIFLDISEMEKAALRCKTIVENLLAFTRQSVGSEIQVTRISDLIKLVINIMELQTRGLGIKIERQLHEPDAKLKVNTNQIVQVLVNVMQNSCESIAERMGSGKRLPPGKIIIRSYLNQNTISLEIADNGTGIPSQDLPRVFTPFFTTKDKTKNPGLGLSVSYQIVKEHGGQMEISSVYGQSTTVAIALPALSKTQSTA